MIEEIRSGVRALIEEGAAAHDPGAWLDTHAVPRTRALLALAPAEEIMRWLRSDPETAFVVYEAPRGVCAKPAELAWSLLAALVREGVQEARDRREA